MSRSLRVSLNFSGAQQVGTLAEDGRRVYFEYSEAFLATKLELSPLRLPLRAGLLEHRVKAGVPIPGVFSDARPDGWGLKLLHRHFQAQGRPASSVSALEELAYLGARTMGALQFHPSQAPDSELGGALELGELAAHAQAVYDSATLEVLPELARAGASSGGARPKALIGIGPQDQLCSGEGPLPTGYRAWLVKFPTSQDDGDTAAREQVWMQMARLAGLQVPKTRLLPIHQGHAFAVQRFDRGPNGERLHMLSAAGALDVDFRTAQADYRDLGRLTLHMCQDMRQVQALLRLALFNAASVNQDDHLKNLAYLMGPNGQWRLSPVFDLTYSPHPSGHRSSAVMGETQRVTQSHALELGNSLGLSTKKVRQTLDEVISASAQVSQLLAQAGCGNPVSQRAATQVKLATQALQS
ncbi:MAG: serine/threonine-protein kinase HipA [Cognaticolwellia sp.]